jgi:hypothetical protein
MPATWVCLITGVYGILTCKPQDFTHNDTKVNLKPTFVLFIYISSKEYKGATNIEFLYYYLKPPLVSTQLLVVSHYIKKEAMLILPSLRYMPSNTVKCLLLSSLQKITQWLLMLYTFILTSLLDNAS